MPRPAVTSREEPIAIILQTRFSIFNYPSGMIQKHMKHVKSRDDYIAYMYGEERLDATFYVFENFTVSSIKAQTLPPHRWYIYTSPELPDKYKKRLKKAIAPIAGAKVVEIDDYEELPARSSALLPTKGRYITVNIDDDDCFHPFYLEILANYYEPHFVLSPRYGYMMSLIKGERHNTPPAHWDKKRKASHFEYPKKVCAASGLALAQGNVFTLKNHIKVHEYYPNIRYLDHKRLFIRIIHEANMTSPRHKRAVFRMSFDKFLEEPSDVEKSVAKTRKVGKGVGYGEPRGGTRAGTRKARVQKGGGAKAQTIDLVLSRYKEPLDWLQGYKDKPFHKVYIYNKSKEGGEGPALCKGYEGKCTTIQLPNVGVCDHTYLHHIIENYNSLADLTIFLPASANMPHKMRRTIATLQKAFETGDTVLYGFKRATSVKEHNYNFTLDKWVTSHKENRAPNDTFINDPASIRPFGKWYEANFPGVSTQFESQCGIFAISKGLIHQRPVEFYRGLLNQVNTSKYHEAAHFIERSWPSIFHPFPEEGFRSIDSLF